MPTKKIPITLKDGKERELRLDWSSLCRFEREFGFSVVEIGRKFGVGKVSFVDVTNVLWAALLHEENPLTLTEVESFCEEKEFFNYLKVIAQVIEEAIPSPDPEKLKNELGSK